MMKKKKVKIKTKLKIVGVVLGIGITVLSLLLVVTTITSIFTSFTQAIVAMLFGQEEEKIVNTSATWEPFSITGRKDNEALLLTFSFNSWKIKDIKIPLKAGNHTIKVQVPKLTGSKKEIAYQYFIRQGFTPEGASGLLANIAVESGYTFSPTIEENGAPYRGEEVTGKGYGVCQWTNFNSPTGRRYKLINAMKSKGFSYDDDSDEHLLAQLEYALTETGYEDIVEEIKTATSPADAAYIWCTKWEKPGDMYNQGRFRGSIAEDYFKELSYLLNDTPENEEQLATETLDIELIERDGKFMFTGKLGDVKITGHINNSLFSIISGFGKYGSGATLGGELLNPYGDAKFIIGDIAAAPRTHPQTGAHQAFHGGWDLIAGSFGQPIYSVSDGEVILAGPYGGYGNHVVVIKSDDIYVLYAHMQKMTVSKGDQIYAGQNIGEQGSEGISTGPHLHLEFMTNFPHPADTYEYSTAYLDAVSPMLEQNATNFGSKSKEFVYIIR